VIREGMFGPGLARPGDPPGSLTLADYVFWAVLCGDLDRAEKLISDSEAKHERSEAATQETVPDQPQANAAPPHPLAGGRAAEFPYRYAWNRMGRKGQRCAVLVRGKMNSCAVEFEDGFKAVTSRNALRKAKRTMNPPVVFTLEEIKRRAIMEAMEACDGDVTAAAERLGIGRSTLYGYLADQKYSRPLEQAAALKKKGK